MNIQVRELIMSEYPFRPDNWKALEVACAQKDAAISEVTGVV